MIKVSNFKETSKWSERNFNSLRCESLQYSVLFCSSYILIAFLILIFIMNQNDEAGIFLSIQSMKNCFRKKEFYQNVRSYII